jgi:hypothetical protein
MSYLINELRCIGLLVIYTYTYKLCETDGLCVRVCVRARARASVIDRSRTGLTAGSNDGRNEALSPRDEGNYLIYRISINCYENALKFVHI